MKVSTSITSSLIAIIATLSSHSVHVNGELRFLKPDNKQCTTPCDCFVENGVRGESKQQIATCKIFVGEGAGYLGDQELASLLQHVHLDSFQQLGFPGHPRH